MSGIKESIAVLGAGSFGTTLANVLCLNGHQVKVWAINPEVVEEINQTHRNSKYLNDAALSENLIATLDIYEAIKGCDYILWAIPTQAIRSVLEEHIKILNHDHFHINVAKGIESKTKKRVSEVFSEFGIDAQHFALLAGPSHAEEVVLQKATAMSSISENHDLAKKIQSFFTTDYLRIYTNTDLVGSEMAGAFKNVVAIACGICDGYGLGDNAKAALVARGIAELSQLVEDSGGEAATLSGLTGVGDLIATCFSKHSRNRFVGEELGKGRKLQDILNDMIMVAEGVKTCEAFHKIQLDSHVEMPIVEATYSVMFGDKTVSEIIQALMTRASKDEF
jgi:glycerol-3-phosphate dehydrogenase (NAD(P)+)